MPLALDIRSDLAKHLKLAGVARIPELTCRDYLKAYSMYCTERFAQSGQRRHAATIDFDRDTMEPVFDLAGRLKAAKLRGDTAAMPALERQIADAVLATLDVAVLDKCVDELQSIRFAERAAAEGTDNWLCWDDGHADDYRAERLGHRQSLVELQREIAEEARL